MRKLCWLTYATPAILSLLVGCGSGAGGGSNDFEANNTLTVTNILSSSSSSGSSSSTAANQIQSNAVEQTDDLGCDHTANTGDAGEGNRFPDACENIVAGGELRADLGTISFKNNPRGATGTGVDLSLLTVDITYLDEKKQSRTFAPTQHYSVTLNVPSEGTADLVGIALVPVAMKYGVRDFLLAGTADSAGVRNWTAVVDVYAKDLKNDNGVHTQGQFSIVFRDPMVEGP